MTEAQGLAPTVPLPIALLPAGPLLVEPDYLLQQLMREAGRVQQAGSAQILTPEVTAAPLAMSGYSGTGNRTLSVAVVRFNGLIREYMAERIVEALNSAYADRAISGVLLKTNTGGGSVTASEMIADAVASRNKPLITHANFMASGGVLATKDSDEIIAANDSAIIGSIGVVQEVATWMREFLNRYFTFVYADTSPGKSASYREYLRTGDTDVFKPLLNQLDAQFMAAMTAARPLPAATRAETLEGGTWLAGEAMRRGLVDSIGGTNYALTRLAEAIHNYS